MASSFIGLPVLIRLRTGANDSAEGVLSALDPQQGTLTLSEARVNIGGVLRVEGIKVLRREDVAGLELLSVERGGGAPATAAAAQNHQQPEQDGVRRTQGLQPPVQHVPYQQPAYAPSPLPSPSPLTGSPKPAAKQRRNRNGRGSGRRQKAYEEALESEDGEEADMSTAYVDEDTSARRRQPRHAQPSFDDEFDFSAGLASFDKARVFDQIRSHDTVDPSLRLVAHNRNPARTMTPQTKLLPTENVLSQDELQEQQQERMAAIAARGSGGSATATPSGGSDEEGGRRRETSAREALGRLSLDDGVARLVTKNGVRVPTVKARQWKEALSISDIESSPSTLQRIESTAYALVQHIFSLPLPTLDPPRSRPSIVLLVTDGEKGLAALRAGTLLVHRGCRVAALVEEGVQASEGYRTGLRVLSSAGGRIVKDVADLPTSPSLVVDALSLPASSSGSLSASTSSANLALTRPDTSSTTIAFAVEAVKWALSDSGAELTLAVEGPFGLDADTSEPLPTLPLCWPTHLLCLGLPRPVALTAVRQNVQVALADIGFAPSLWERVGVEGFELGTLGTQGIVELMQWL
ncbi:hypothetical protein JCM10213_004245 [Rhodosporidiobolus nylandii]